MRTPQKRLTILFATVAILATTMACEKKTISNVKQASAAETTATKKNEPILLESIKSGYKFYSPCINYTGKIAKNEGC